MTTGWRTGGLVALPTDAAAPPDAAWGPMLVVALVVVAVVAMIVGFGRITRRRPPDDAPTGDGTTGGATTDDPLPTDPQQDEPGRTGRREDPDEPGPPPA